MSRHFYLPESRSRTIFRARWRVLGNHPWRAAAVTAALCALAAVAGIAWMQDGMWLSGRGNAAKTPQVGSRSVSTPSVEQSDAAPAAPIPASQKADAGGAHPIRLQVLNGCAIKDMAKIIAPLLRAKGFDVRELRRAGRTDYGRTVVIDRVGRMELAQIVADSLGVDRTLVSTEASENLADIDVTIILGADYRQLRFDLHSQKE